MSKHAHSFGVLVGIAAFAVLAASAAYAGWAFFEGSKVGAGWAGLSTAWPFLLAGVLTVAVVIALFVRLAFYSERHGYDERADLITTNSATLPTTRAKEH